MNGKIFFPQTKHGIIEDIEVEPRYGSFYWATVLMSAKQLCIATVHCCVTLTGSGTLKSYFKRADGIVIPFK